MDQPKYSVEQLKRLQISCPEFKIRYGPRERGWAHDLGGGFAVIDNIPYDGPLHYLDVVEVVNDSNSVIPTAGRVVWRAYELKTAIRYPRDDPERWYRAIRDACKAIGWAIEGATDGLCMVCHHTDPPLQQALRDAGINVDQLVFIPENERHA